MLKNLSLTLKLSLLPAVALLGLLLFVGYTSIQLSANDKRLVTLETHSFPSLEKADAVIFQFSRLPGLLNSAVAAGELETLGEARQVLGEIASMQQALQPLTRANAERTNELEQWRAAIGRYADNALSASEQLIKGSAGFDDLRPSLDRMASDLKTAQDLGSVFRAHTYKDFQDTLAQARTDNADTTRVGFILTALLVALVGLGAWLIIRGIMGNVHGVIESLQAIAKGDGDLTRRVNVDSRDEIGEMIQLFNGFLDKLQNTIRQIIDAASPLGQMSKELYRLTQEAEENAKSQQGHTDSIGRDIQTMTSSIQEVAQRSQQASQGAGDASRQAVAARTSIGALSGSISDLGSSVLGAVQAMQQLEEETQQVGSVLTVIRSIAEQTNLLALNAAIEAARAGEQGRGFAVVADEVRNLAQKTAASTAEIQQIIQRLQNSANGVLDVMTANGDKAQASIERSVEATHMLETIATAVGQIDELNAGIAQLTQEQIGLSSSIQQDTQVLQQDAQATAHGADATARLGEQLVSTGDHLRAATAQFRV
ncbi:MULTISPECIES: methyl-accepting chemotaxis protein [Pseudomonas]|uniref:methyl-accepting chemotaxis protein n=1 Tax=Pseudomonas TaxID=286 RepID=UPI001C81B5B0|nr:MULTISPECIES: methyl-accepting chemotaxis protein [Pseudomonas]MDG9926607.1 methyl-accepting chemotaxis protein [Pseudomonas sp. GD04042]MDH0482324.1 methyl-accepting chemotaxis protein [Pseudomonas sp. GD04015]MDH0603759.1 methyl-accepting chemotaxis protein [Pseudomonas sp. GD03869]MDH0893582.1 methyl-accepting chemotaxis protein [Pseudomonas sp. GD03875]MDH1065767.1 methyl-accepting chemotaxis protein [Pseudomonas sp. GD03985]